MPLAVSGTPEPIRRECIVCHTDKEDLATLRHPGGAGTPQGDGSNIADACKSCHMPKPAGGTGLYVHVMRINTNPNYSTFPKAGATTPGICSDPYYKTRAACIAAGKSWSLVANSAPDGDYKNAVWVDLDLACGQCHGEGGEANRDVQEAACAVRKGHTRRQLEYEYRADSSNDCFAHSDRFHGYLQR